jgi:hypothetical protein
MEKEILARMEGISLYGYISLAIFVGFFTGMLLWAFARKKNYLNKMGALPLDGAERAETPDQISQR